MSYFRDDQDGQNGLSGLWSWICGVLNFNGSTWDRVRNNLSGITLATLVNQSTITNQPSADQINYNGCGLKVFINITAISGVGATLVVQIQGKDPVSGVYYTILTSLSLAVAGMTVLLVHAGFTASANVSVNDEIPRDWRILYTVAGTSPNVSATIAAAVNI